MNCPQCGGSRVPVTSTFNHGAVVQRYRRCRDCGHRWKSWEENDTTPVRSKQSAKPAAAPAINDLFDVPRVKGGTQ